VKASERLALLRSAGLAPKKSFGQNFLVSDPVLARIAETWSRGRAGRGARRRARRGLGALTGRTHGAGGARHGGGTRPRSHPASRSLDGRCHRGGDALHSRAGRPDARPREPLRSADRPARRRVLAGNLRTRSRGSSAAGGHTRPTGRPGRLHGSARGGRPVVALPGTKAYGASRSSCAQRFPSGSCWRCHRARSFRRPGSRARWSR